VSAAERFAAMDFDATDGPSVDDLGIDYGWPEPDEPCANVDLAVQLYWPEPDEPDESERNEHG
jgi:hypothetical protein